MNEVIKQTCSLSLFSSLSSSKLKEAAGDKEKAGDNEKRLNFRNFPYGEVKTDSKIPKGQP